MYSNATVYNYAQTFYLYNVSIAEKVCRNNREATCFSLVENSYALHDMPILELERKGFYSFDTISKVSMIYMFIYQSIVSYYCTIYDISPILQCILQYIGQIPMGVPYISILYRYHCTRENLV